MGTLIDRLFGKNIPSAGAIGGHNVRFIKQLGSGGEGNVYAAHVDSVDACCAIKIPQKSYRSRLEHEITAMNTQGLGAQVRYVPLALHQKPLPIQLNEKGTTVRDTECILLPLFAKGSLADCMARQREHLPHTAENIAALLAMSSLCLRDAGVVHGDIKPANILIDDRGTIAVTDWSGARAEGTAVSDGAKILRTLHYMAPETARSYTEQHHQDVYALACIGWELLNDDPKLTRKRVKNIKRAGGPQQRLEAVVDDKQNFMENPSDGGAEPYMMTVINQAHAYHPDDRSHHIDLLTDLTPFQRAREHFMAPDWDAIADRLMERTATPSRRNPWLDVAATRATADHWGGDPARRPALEQLANALEHMHPDLAQEPLSIHTLSRRRFSSILDTVPDGAHQVPNHAHTRQQVLDLEQQFAYHTPYRRQQQTPSEALHHLFAAAAVAETSTAYASTDDPPQHRPAATVSPAALSSAVTHPTPPSPSTTTSAQGRPSVPAR